MRSIERELERHPGLSVAGNGLHGVSFGRSAAAGIDAGERAAAELARVAANSNAS